MLPQSGVGGCVPRPRKLRPAVSMIAMPTHSVVCTMSGASVLGSTCCAHDARVVGAQRARRVHVLARAHRQHRAARDARVVRDVHDADGDHRVAQPRPEDRHDGDRQQDVRKRQHDVHAAHDQAVGAPAVEGGDAGRTRRRRPAQCVAATAPASSDACAPQMMRLNTSRPNSSVPIRCCQLGGWRSTRKSCRVGL